MIQKCTINIVSGLKLQNIRGTKLIHQIMIIKKSKLETHLLLYFFVTRIFFISDGLYVYYINFLYKTYMIKCNNSFAL